MSQGATKIYSNETLDLFLSVEEVRVHRVLFRHRGSAAAIRSDLLADLTGMENVKVREIVRELIVTHGLPIGSSVAWPAGYYWMVDREEIEENVRKLRHRGLSVLYRAACLKRIGLRALLREIQTELALEEA